MKIYVQGMLEDAVMESVADGEGVRLVLFLNGCAHQCEGCHNTATWSRKNGVPFEVEEVVEYVMERFLKHPYDGITISGGDPLMQWESTLCLTQKLKRQGCHNIWVYTGYEWTSFSSEQKARLSASIDTLVDGKYEKDKRYPICPFRGSWNQQIIHLKEEMQDD